MPEASVVDVPRKKSPRAPSLGLEEALSKALSAYERERLHPAPTEVVAQNIGYSGANNGRALSTLASLRYFGMLERPKEGLLAVTKDVETYKFAPDEQLKRSLLIGFLRRPQLFAELLEKYESGLPSDGNLKFELIQRGFAPQAAEGVLAAFKESVDFAHYFEANGQEIVDLPTVTSAPVSMDSPNALTRHGRSIDAHALQQGAAFSQSGAGEAGDLDRIPVRLPGARRAWILVPTPFFKADKERLKAQIDLLLTEEDEQETKIDPTE